MAEYEYFKIVKGSSTPYPVHRRDKNTGIVSYYDTLDMVWFSYTWFGCSKCTSVQDFINNFFDGSLVGYMTEEEVDRYLVQSELEK